MNYLFKLKYNLRSGLAIIYNKYKGTKKNFKRSDLYNFHNGKNLEKINIDDKRFQSIGSKLEVITAKIDPSIPSVLGWLPYIKNYTRLVFYNFFSTNYSIRKQSLLRISLVKNLNVIDQKIFWIPSLLVHDFDLRELFNKLDANSFFVEMFNPKIPINHGYHDGHLRCWGKYTDLNENFLSTVHSMPHSNHNFYAHYEDNLRSYFYNHKNISSKILASPATTNKLPVHKHDVENSHKSIYGYNVILDQKNVPRSVWHHAPPPENLDKSDKCRNSQTIWFPELTNLNPVVVIDNKEIGINNKNDVCFTIFKKEKIYISKKMNINGFFKKNINDIFDEIIVGPYTILVDFNSTGFAYIQFHFDTFDFPGDQVHSNESLGKFENGKFIPNIMIRKSARKFFHYHLSNYKSKNYLVFNTCKVKDVDKPKIKVRIYTDKFEEFVRNIQVNYDFNIMVIDIDEIFPELKKFLLRCAIVQLESNDYNFPGYFLHCNMDNQTVAVDHLTGG